MAENKPDEKLQITFSSVLKALLKLLIAAALIVWIIIRDREKLLTAVSSLNGWAVAACGLCIFIQVSLTAKRWQWLLRSQGFTDIPYSAFFVLMFQGSFANLFIPAGAVGGDIVKAALIAKQMPPERKLIAAVSILTDRIVGMAGLFTISLVMFCVCLPEILRMDNILRTAAFLIALLCLTGLTAAAVVFFQDMIFRWRFAAWLLSIGDRLLKGFPSRIISAVSAYRKQWRILLYTTLFSAFVLNPLMIAAVAIPLYSVAETRPSLKHVITASSFGNSASVIPLTPGGFGTRDKVAQEFFKVWNTDSGAASAAVLVYTAMLLVVYLFGGIFFLIPQKEKK